MQNIVEPVASRDDKMRVTTIRNVSDGDKRICVDKFNDIIYPKTIDYVETKYQKISSGVHMLYGTVHDVYECNGDIWFTVVGLNAVYMVELDKPEVVRYGYFKDSTKLSGGHMW